MGLLLMKPNKTSMLLRSIIKDLKPGSVKVDNLGFVPKDDLVFPDPTFYKEAKAFAVDYQLYNLARKRSVKTATSAQMRAGLGKWIESEIRCDTVNKCHRWVEPINPDARVRVNRLIEATRTIISQVLMDQWPEMDFDPTGGATACVKRKYSIPSSKVDGTPLTDETQPHKCSPASRVYLEQMFHANPAVARRFMRARYKLIDESFDLHPIEMYWPTDDDIHELAVWCCSNVPPASFDYVPKDIGTVRLIAKSNSLSIMVQKTFGKCIRQALLKVGIDLNDQTINQEWAEIGSLTGLVATVDLSAASDSISRHLISWFPRRWQAYFNASRDTHVSAGSTTHKLAMVAGMGNGYIFELESLLFYAMTRAVVEECKLDTSMISIYGDDIICPVGAVALLEEFFLSVGFLLNKEKSFSHGKFRESCGKHYFNGVDVTPWYVKSDLDNMEELYHCYNGLSEWSHRTGVPLDSSLTQILNCIPLKERCLVPPSWSTKSGLHYLCPGIQFPEKKWIPKWQRYEVVWSVLTPKPSLNICSMLPEWTQVTHALIEASSLDDVCDPKFFLKAVLSPCSVIGSKPTRPHGHIRESKPMNVTWSLEPIYHRTKHRDVSLCGDA